MVDETPFELSRPLRTHKGEVTVLMLKEPTAGSFLRYGCPFTVKAGEGGALAYTFDEKATVGFLFDMTGHDSLVLEGLSGADYFKLRYAVPAVMFTAEAGGRNPTVTSGA